MPADEKISALPAASGVGNADLLAIVQAGSTLKATRAQLLAALAGQPITLQASFGEPARLLGDGLSEISVDGGGFITIVCDPAATMTLRDGNSVVSITVDPGSETVVVFATNGFNATFVSPNVAVWPTGAPATVVDALQKLATAIFSLSTGTLP
jgi:hypothetical protein